MNKNIKEVDMDGIEPSIFHRRWKILATLCASLLVAMLANSSLNLALPIMAQELQLTSLDLTWIVDVYPLIFASLLFTAAAVADRFGRKFIMQIGLVIFLGATLYAGFFANSGTELIIARAIMGIGGAMVMPTTLSIIENIFPRRERARAIAVWSGIAGGGVALGSIASGFLLEYFSWESVFILSAVIGLVGLIFNQWLTPESRDERQTPIDWLGGVLSFIGILGLVYGIIEAPSHGFGADVIAALVVGALGLAAFVWRQLSVDHPMLDVRLFKSRVFTISSLSIMLVFFALMGIFFSISQLFQLVMEYGALESSLRLLPIMMVMMVFSPFVPTVVKKIGVRWTMSSGLLLVSVGFVLMSLWPTIPTYWEVMGGMSVMMFGMALAMTPSTNLLMSSVPKNRAGMGSATNDTTRELGGALGIAVLGAILSSIYAEEIIAGLQGLPQQVIDVAESSLAGALAVGEQMGVAGLPVIETAKVAWMNGLSQSMVVAAGIVAVAAVAAAIWLPSRHHDEDDLTAESVTEVK